MPVRAPPSRARPQVGDFYETIGIDALVSSLRGDAFGSLRAWAVWSARRTAAATPAPRCGARVPCACLGSSFKGCSRRKLCVARRVQVMIYELDFRASAGHTGVPKAGAPKGQLASVVKDLNLRGYSVVRAA